MPNAKNSIRNHRKTQAPKVIKKWPIKRLLTQIHKEAEKPLVWISASAGSGKTVQAISYLEHYSLSHAWYQLDQYDAIPETFFHYLYTALQPHLSDPNWQPPLYNAALHHDLNNFADRFFSQLMEQVENETVLVFDNYQDASSQAGFAALFVRLVDVAPEHITIFVLSRNSVSPEFNSLLANRKIGFIGAEDLKLNPAESKRLIEKVYPEIDVNKAQLNNIQATSGGWIAGTVLQMEALRMNIRSGSLIEQPQDRIFNYFSHELLQHMSDHRRRFLLHSAFFPRFTREQLVEFYPAEDYNAVIDDLVSKNHFIYCQSDDNQENYHYHPLFRQFLIELANKHFSREEYKKRLAQAAEIIATTTNDAELTVPMLIEATAWDKVVQQLNDHTEAFITAGRHKTILKWLSQIPEDVISASPWLQFWRGSALVIEKPFQGYQSLNDAFDQFTEEGDLTGQLVCWTNAANSIILHWADYTLADKWLTWLDAFIDAGGKIPENIIGARLATAALTACSVRGPTHRNALYWASEAVRLSEYFGDDHDKLLAYSYFTFYQTMFGSCSEGQLIFERGQHLVQKSSGSAVVDLTWSWLNAAILWMHGKAELSLKIVGDGVELADKTGIHIVDHLLYAEGAYAALNLEDLDTAMDFIQQMCDVISSDNDHMLGHYHYLMTWYLLRQGRTSDALTHIVESTIRTKKTGCIWTLAMSHMLHVRSLVAQGDYHQATNVLAELKATVASSVNCTYFHLNYLQEEAWLHYCSGNTLLAVQLSEALFEQLVESGYSSLFGWDPVIFSELAALLIEHNISNPNIAAFVRQRNIPPPKQFPASAWPWRVQITTFPEFTLLFDGKPLSRSGKGSNKQLALLKTLIALGGDNVPEHRIYEALWPDTDGDMAHVNLTSTLYRLRKLLPCSEAIVLKEHRLSLNRNLVFIDLWEFNTLVSCISSQLSNSQPEPAAIMQHVTPLLGLYRGEFLADEDEPHYIHMRNTIHHKWLSLLHTIAQLLTQTKYWHDVTRIYEKALEVDSTDEESYRGLFRAYMHTGRQGEVELLYRRCVRELERHHGKKPDSQTLQLYQSLKYSA